MADLAPTLQAFFTDRLARQRGASPHTVAAYRDTLRLLLTFAHQRPSKPPSTLDLADLDAPLIGTFLDHLQHDRGNTVRTPHPRLPPIPPPPPGSTPCPGSPPYVPPSTPRSSNGYWPSRPRSSTRR